MPKNEIFLEKTVKTAEALGAPPSTPVGIRQLGLSPRPRVIVLIYYCNFEILMLLLVDTQKYFTPRRRGILVTLLVI